MISFFFLIARVCNLVVDAKPNKLVLSLGWVTFWVTGPSLKSSQVSYLRSLDEFQRLFCECLKIQCKSSLCERVYGFSRKTFTRTICVVWWISVVCSLWVRLPGFVSQHTTWLFEQTMQLFSASVFSKLQK